MARTNTAETPLSIHQALRLLPKAELHLHLGGAVAADTFVELAALNGVSLPAFDTPADLYDYDDLGAFLEVYTLVSASVISRSDFQRVTYECLERCARSGARHVELFFSPESHLPHGVSYGTMLGGVTSGLRDAELDFGLTASLIPAINRELGGKRAVEFVEMIQQSRTDDVVGVGLDFNEVGFPADGFVAAFDLAGSFGLRRTSHAGEVGPAKNIRDGIELLGCDRIDHGYNIVTDGDLMSSCARDGIPFTVCPTTTTFTSDFRDLADPDHAIRRMFDRGLTMTVNSDDPPMFGVELVDEYVTMHDVMGFGFDDLVELAMNGIDVAWVDDATKRDWRRVWTADLESIRHRLRADEPEASLGTP
ncbi:MAG: adenosine deaminase [Ilumatobacter sp.]